MRKWLTGLLVILTLGLGASVMFLRFSADKTGPEITFQADKKEVYTDGTSEEELLDGVQARDDKDGDVSDTLMVESMYSTKDGEQMVVIYAAKDKSNNVTKAEFVMENESSETSVRLDEEDEGEPETDMQDEDGEETEENISPTPTPELTAQEQARQEQEALIEQLSPQAPKFYLTEYYVEVPLGSSFDALSYVKEIQDDTDDTFALWKKIQLEGQVNTAAAGTYELTFYVVDSAGNSSNRAVMTVVVGQP